MKIFIFKPSYKWSYCGGGRVVIAKDIDSVKAMFPHEHMLESEKEETEHDWYRWILITKLDTTEVEEGIILDDYYWA